MEDWKLPVLIGTAQFVFGRLVDIHNRYLPKEDQRFGGFLCVLSNNGHPILLIPIGVIPEAKVDKYSQLAVEKAERVCAQPGIVTSWLSRDERENKFGGAIWTPRGIFSFSGLTEIGDEASVILVANMTNRLVAPVIQASYKSTSYRLVEMWLNVMSANLKPVQLT